MNTFIVGLGRVSAQAALLVFLVLLLQRLFKLRLSPRGRCALWFLPALRLLLPVSFSSGLSLFNLAPSLDFARRPTAVQQAPANGQPTDRVIIYERNRVFPFEATAEQIQREKETERNFDLPSTELGKAAHGIAGPNIAGSLPSASRKIKPSPPTIQLLPTRATATEAPDWPVILFAIWFAGTVFLFGRVAFACRQLSGELSDAEEISDPAVCDLLQGCAEELRVTSPVRLVESPSITSPLLHGLWRPRLVLPAGLREELSWDELRFVLLHELAHVRRRDILQNWFGTILQIIHWFNPFVWLAFARWRADRELACDALALETAGEGKKQEYGRTILRLLEVSRNVLGAPAMVGILEDKRQLRERISMIAAFSPGKRWNFLAILLLLALGLAGLTDARRAVKAAANEVAANLTPGGATPPVFEPLQPAAPKPTNGATVKVTVVNEVGQALKGAKIMAPHQAVFFMGQGNSPTWETDQNGMAEIRLGELSENRMQQNGWFTMSISHPDYAPIGMSWATQNGDARSNVPSQIKAVLKKGTKIGGLVQDERGRPLPNVRVGVFGNTYSYQGGPNASQAYSQYWSDPRYEPAATTDASGRWNADNVPADLDRLDIMLLRPDGSMYNFTSYSPENPFGQPSAEAISAEKLRQRNETFILKDGWSVHGQVLDPSGKPVPNLLVREVYNRYMPANGIQFRTDRNGKFELQNRRRRQLLLIASPENYAIQAQIVDRKPEGADVTFRLENLNPLRIQIVDENDRGVPKAQVYLDAVRSGKIALPLSLTADADGTVVWTNAPLADLALIASSPTSAVNRNFRIKAGDSRNARIQLRSEMAKEIKITGNALDADTGEAVKLSACRILTQPWASPIAQEVTGSTLRASLPSSAFQQGVYPDFAIQCEADGYATYTSERRDFNEGDLHIEVRMKRGSKPGGTLLLTDGSPAVGAEVIATTREQDYLFMNTPGKIWRNERALKVTADDEGKFELKDPGFDGLVLITHEDGFLQTSTEKLASHPKLTLQPWGRVEGVLKVGTKPEPNAHINLSGNKYLGKSGGWNFVLSTETDNSGHFSFDKVPPGESHLYRYFNPSPGPITETYQWPVIMKAGETTHVDYGGTGRPVIGQVEGNADWKNDIHLLVLKPKAETNALARPSAEDYFDPDEFQKVWDEYNRKGQQANHPTSYYLKFAEDGSFRAEDVPAGTYELRIKVTEPLKPGENRYGPVSPDKEIASLTREVIVPEIPDGRSDEPLDLGTFELNWKGPQASQPPISLAAQTMDGKSFSLESLRGKFVLLNFWTTWSENSQEQMGEVSALSARFKDDARLAFIGVNLGEPADKVRKRAKANGYTTDQVMLAGAALAAITESLNVDALPSAFLLNPKGQIIARDLKSDNLERTLQSALKRQSKE
jgi:beta-lactamase regulating signal transducer with metallopeptidase domain